MCDQSPELSSPCKMEIWYLSNNSCSFPPPSSLWQPPFYHLSLSLTLLRTSYKWNPTILSFPDWLVSLNIMSRVHPYWSIWQNSFPSYGWIMFHHMYMPHFIYLFTYQSYLSCFPITHLLKTSNFDTISYFLCVKSSFVYILPFVLSFCISMYGDTHIYTSFSEPSEHKLETLCLFILNISVYFLRDKDILLYNHHYQNQEI